MDVILRVVGVSFLVGFVTAFLGYSALGEQHSDTAVVSLLLGCVGAVIGAIAAGAREIVSAKNAPAPPDHQEATPFEGRDS
jgi:hypothetical protein